MRPLTLGQQLLISVHNFGLNFHWGALLAVAIPRLVLRFTAEAAKGRVLGSVYAGGPLVALLALAYAPTLGFFILAFLFVQFAYNLGAAAYGGFIPDLVPEQQRGAVSGFWG